MKDLSFIKHILTADNDISELRGRGLKINGVF